MVIIVLFIALGTWIIGTGDMTDGVPVILNGCGLFVPLYINARFTLSPLCVDHDHNHIRPELEVDEVARREGSALCTMPLTDIQSPLKNSSFIRRVESAFICGNARHGGG